MDCSRAQTWNPDEWMEMTPDFSRPLAVQFREWINSWEPDLNEVIKWNILCFTGRKLVCGLSACQRYLSVAFFRGMELPDPAKLLIPSERNTSILSMRVTSLDQIDPRAFRALLRAAVALDEDPTIPPTPKVKRKPWPMPDYFADALKKNKKAAAYFAELKPTYQREYLGWISAAKRDETRKQRLRQTIKALAAGRKWIDRKLA
jgi:uncharacterized protein YdeI (YjbR/CyaY-like superfamily)